ncbi:MAG: hypothetical protein M3457_17285 [Chloroflexota bacterium]|nr:hypothetical protein [Chloroflexota bacterium]
MTQASDIVLNGDSYMLVPARGREGGTTSYTRSQDGMDEGRTGRIAQTDFFGGLGRALQLERDRGWDGATVGPALGGQGVRPWPFTTSSVWAASGPAADAAWPYPAVQIGDYVYVGYGQYLYRTVALATTTWSAPTMLYDAGAGNIIHGLAYYGGNILITFGGTKDLTHVLYPDATSPAVLFAGERGYDIVSYAGYAIWADARALGAGYPNMLRMVTGSGIQFRWTDSEIRRLTTAQAEVTIATTAAIYAYTGRVAEVTIPNPGTPPPETVEVLRWNGDLRPFFQHGTAVAEDDYAFILGFGGRTYAWIGKMVLEHDPNGERAGWRDTGLHGVTCHGACVAAGYLVVSIVTSDGFSELWAWDGGGWWIIRRDVASSTTWLKPIPLSGAGGFDLGVHAVGTRDFRLFRLVWRSPANHNYSTGPSSYVTSLIDASDRDKDKAWRKIGAEFASPELPGNTASTNPGLSLQLSYSTDAGSSWTVTSTQLVIPGTNTLANNNVVLASDVASDAAVSRFLMLRVSWTGQTDWAPVLVGLWAEFELLDSPARRRRWQFTIQAQDEVIDRDGDGLARTGREQIAELWDHWQTGTTVPYRDLDHDADPTERQVRIVGISEQVPLPHQAGLWGQSLVSLVLVEV